MNWEHILRDSVKDGEIRELHLRNLPVLKNCQNWNEVKEIGSINHKTKYAHYKGLLVRHGNSLYYLPREKVEALKPFRNWDEKKPIKVTDPEKK